MSEPVPTAEAYIRIAEDWRLAAQDTDDLDEAGLMLRHAEVSAQLAVACATLEASGYHPSQRPEVDPALARLAETAGLGSREPEPEQLTLLRQLVRGIDKLTEQVSLLER